MSNFIDEIGWSLAVLGAMMLLLAWQRRRRLKRIGRGFSRLSAGDAAAIKELNDVSHHR